jgi:hypothetical protein
MQRRNTGWLAAIGLKLLGALMLLEYCTAVAIAQNSDVSNEFWPEFDFYIKLNEKSRIFAMYTATKQENLNAYSDGQAGVHLDFYALQSRRTRVIDFVDPSRSKHIMFRAGYLLTRPKNNSGTSTEHMATAEATGRANLPGGLLLSDRNRIDLRWVDGDPKQRYRNRLKLERTFDIGRFQLTPYAHGEVYYELRDRKWTRVRYSVGAEWSVTKRIILEGYYLRQNTWASVPQFVNAYAVAFQFYIR